jgi:hypothetical protein
MMLNSQTMADELKKSAYAVCLFSRALGTIRGATVCSTKEHLDKLLQALY